MGGIGSRSSSLEPGLEGRWRVYDDDELIAHDKSSLDIFWLRDESLADSENAPPPEEIAREIIEDLEPALEQFRLNGGGFVRGRRGVDG